MLERERGREREREREKKREREKEIMIRQNWSTDIHMDIESKY